MRKTTTSVPETETSISKTSKDIIEKTKTVKPNAPIIEEWDTDNDSVFRPKSNQTKPKFTKINFVKSGENVKSVNKENTHSQVEYPRKSQSPRGNRRNWNGIEAIKLFLAYESFMGFIVYQMNVKKAFLYEKALYYLHQAPRAWYKTLSNYLLENGFRKGTIDKTLFIKKDKDDAQEIPDKFYEGAHFLFMVAVKTASTLIETNKALLKDEEVEDVDVHLYRSMIGSLMYLTASRPDIMFVVCACARFQVTPKVLHLHAVNRIFRYLKCQPKLELWYPRDSPFVLEAFSDSDYARATLNSKSTIGDGISDEFGVKTDGCKVNAARQDLVLLGENLKFVDQHNMVACLERTEGNANFHQITKIVNNETQIHAKVDGKSIVISESSVRSNLHFNDEDVQVTTVASHPQKTQTPRRSKRGQDTETPQSGGPPEKVGDEAVHQELGGRVERAATTAASLDAKQDSGNILKTQSTTIPNVPPSQGIGIGGSPRCQEAIGGGNTPGSDEERLEPDDLMDFIPPTPHDSPLSGGHTPGSDEGRPNINELMAIYTNLSNRVLALETSKTAQDLISTFKRKSLDKENVSKQGRNLKTRPMFEEGDFDFDDIDDMVNEAMENVEGDIVNTATTGVSAASASITTASVSISTMRSQKAKEKGKGVAFSDVEESARSTIILPTIDPKDKGKGIMQEPEKPPKSLRKAQIQMDEELAIRLFEEEQAQFEREQRIARERAAEQEAKDAALIEQIKDI
ncbi:hypothetical protein Tco_0723920 [Tanacetum coccineum]